MCKVVQVKIGNKTVNVADLKEKNIYNIAEAAKQCKYIERIVLFGSSISERCEEDSDIDIAVFGNVSKSKCLTSKSFKEFAKKLYIFDDYKQDYDILYFSFGQSGDVGILGEIGRGEVIYARE